MVANTKPTKIKILEGNPGKRPLNQYEPDPVPEIPTCPIVLTNSAKREWKRLCREFIKLGLISQIDRSALAIVCQNWGDFLTYRAGYNKIKDQKGQFGKSLKLLRSANDASERFMRNMQQFGMSPASRAKISVMPKAKSKDPLENILQGVNLE